MSAARLREAARVLREVAEGATPGPWEFGIEDAQADMPPDYAIWMPEVGHDGALVELEADARYIATMSPPVALALADWLDDIVVIWSSAEFMADGDGDPISFGESIDSHALKLADAILGDPR